MRNWLNNALVTAGIAVSLLLEGCSAVRHVPEGRYLLDKVNISVEGDKDIPSADLYNYLRQTPNHKVLGFWKLQLGTYNLSGNDSTKWYNRWVRRMGQPPVIYEQALTDASARQLHLAMINRGYLNAHVEVDTTIRTEKRRIDVRYNIFTGEPHVIRSVTYDIPDSAVASVIMADSTKFTVKTGDKFDRDNLDSERTLITRRLRNRGYYAFNKDYITYYADTAANSCSVDLTMAVRPPRRPNGADTAADSAAIHTLYRIGKVYFITDSDGDRSNLDTVSYKGVDIVYGRDRYLKPGALEEKCFLIPGQLYSPHNVDRTYESIARLGILKSINIELVPEATLDNGDRLLDAYIRLSRNKKQSITLDIEGTNSEGDLGFGVGATYQHRNLAKGS
ncbi:POTRA domain-containing protein, partial [uncultured Duncaniella sp.]